MFLLNKVNKIIEKSVKDYNNQLNNRSAAANESAANAILSLVKAKTILEHPEVYGKIEEEEDNIL